MTLELSHGLTQDKIIQAFSELGKKIQNRPEKLQVAVRQAASKNRWFEEAAIWQALDAISNWLTTRSLQNWLTPYGIKNISTKTVGLVLAGNLPLVGFHDVLAVLCGGYRAKIKLSSDDQVLYHYLLKELITIEAAFTDRVEIIERLNDFDLVIATGSDNSSRYFEYYFGKTPHIIRKNRNSIAVLDGNETSDQLHQLGHDIFDYYGMGCRSVSKIFIPENYDLVRFFEGIQHHDYVKDNFKYFNNYEFQKSILLINGIDHFDNGYLLVKEDFNLASPLAVLYFERYSNLTDLEVQLESIEQRLQCIVSDVELKRIQTPIVEFGKSQQPSLNDYADQVDTLQFLADNHS